MFHKSPLLGHSIVPVWKRNSPAYVGSGPPIAPPSKRPVKLIVGIVLIILLLAASGDSSCITMLNSKSCKLPRLLIETRPNQSINSFKPTCISVRTDSSALYGTPGSYSGYRTVYETLGINNPTRFAMDATWDLTLNYPVVHWILSDTESFQRVSQRSGSSDFSATGSPARN